MAVITSAVILEPRKIKSATVSTVSPSICHELMGPDAMIFVLWMLSFKPGFHSALSLSSSDSLVPLYFLPWGWCHFHPHIWDYWYFSRQKWVAFPFSRGSSQPRDCTHVSHTAGGFFTSWATRLTIPNVSKIGQVSPGGKISPSWARWV